MPNAARVIQLVATVLLGFLGSRVKADLVHQWTFNGAATDHIGGAHGRLFGGAAVSGGRLVLDGIDDFMLTAPIDRDIGPRTLVAWIGLANLTQRSGSALTIENGNGDTFDGIVLGERVARQWMNGSDGWSRTVPNNGGSAETSAAPAVVMMAITYAADSSIAIYRNGMSHAGTDTASQGGLETYEAGMARAVLGLRHTPAADQTGTPSGNDPFLAGEIDEARIYSGVLGADELTALYGQGPSTLPAPPLPPRELLHLWTFECDASDAVGSSHGVFHGRSAVVGGSLVLDGVDDYVLTAPIDRVIGPRTVVAWLSLDNLAQRSASAVTLESGAGNVFDGIVFGERVARQWMNGSDGWSRTVADNGSPLETVSSPGVLMMAIAYDGVNNITIYRNGIVHATPSSATAGNLRYYAANSARVIFGKRHSTAGGGAGTPDGNDAFLAARIHEARIYAGAMTAAEVAELFVQGPADTDSDGDGLSDYWERMHFGNLDQDAEGDWDNDGHSNGDEQITVTDPRDSTSFFALTMVRNPGGSGAHGHDIFFPYKRCRRYLLFSSEDMTNWSTGTSRLRLLGDQGWFRIDHGTGDPRFRFFRVRVSRP